MDGIFASDNDDDEFLLANRIAAEAAQQETKAPTTQEEAQDQPQPQQPPTEGETQQNLLLKQLFGGDSDSDDLGDFGEVQHVQFDDSDEEEEPLPSFKKRSAGDGDGDYDADNNPTASKKKKRRESKKSSADGPDRSKPDAPEKVKTEAENDIDTILQRLKPVRPVRASDLQNEVEVDAIITNLCTAMSEAARTDREYNKEGNPAIAKLKLLPKVMLELSKTHWYNQLLEGNVLECVRFWLDPLDDGSLPSLDIQQSMLTAVDKMQIDRHHLRVSRLGRVVRFYTKCDRVTPAIQRLANSLIRKWMRPILGKPDDLKHRRLKESRVSSAPRRVTMAGKGQFERDNMAAIPQKVAANFSVVPVSSLQTNGAAREAMMQGDVKGVKSDKYRKMKAIMKSKRL